MLSHRHTTVMKHTRLTKCNVIGSKDIKMAVNNDFEERTVKITQ